MNKIILIVGLLFVFLGCQVAEDDFLEVLEPQAQEAMLLAQQEVGDIASGSRTYTWDSTSKVVDAFPVYLDGIDGISYYECKVETGGKDSGYVLVNINDTDFPIVEAQEEGLTVNETFEKITTLSQEDFVVYRYSYTANAAFEKVDDSASIVSRSGSTREPIATIGFEDIDEFNFEDYRSRVKANKGSLFSTVTESETSKDTQLFGMTGKGSEEVYLEQSWDSPFQAGSTPAWSQYRMGDELIGCAPIAIGLVYAYWHVKKGYTELFETDLLTGIDLTKPDEIIDEFIGIWNPEDYVMTRLALLRINDLMGTTGGDTPTRDTWKAQNYARERGYGSFTVTRKNGGYDTKFNMIYDSLAEDRPVLMAIHNDGIGLINHMVVVEHAVRQSVRGNSYIRYYCNFGSGEGGRRPDEKDTPNLWVYAYNQKPVHETAPGYTAARFSTYEIWDIRVQ